MSNAITFTPGHMHLTQSKILDKSYMDLEVFIGGQYRGSVGGYVAKQAIDLIAAAPELLQALTDLGDWLAYGLHKADGAEPTAEDRAACERVAAQARAAIAKATGAQS